MWHFLGPPKRGLAGSVNDSSVLYCATGHFRLRFVSLLPPAVMIRTCNPLPKQKPFHKIPIQCCHNTMFPFPREDFNLIERAAINQNAWKV